MYVQEGATEPMKIERRTATAMTLCVAGVLALGIYPEPAMRAAMLAAAALFGK